jgi:outer membrane autotransporter protein
MVFNTALGDDGSLTDKLIVHGGTGGNSRVTVSDQLIQIDGNSAGNFALPIQSAAER